jgi:hypothetical protein
MACGNAQRTRVVCPNVVYCQIEDTGEEMQHRNVTICSGFTERQIFLTCCATLQQRKRFYDILYEVYMACSACMYEKVTDFHFVVCKAKKFVNVFKVFFRETLLLKTDHAFFQKNHFTPF